MAVGGEGDGSNGVDGVLPTIPLRADVPRHDESTVGLHGQCGRRLSSRLCPESESTGAERVVERAAGSQTDQRHALEGEGFRIDGDGGYDPAGWLDHEPGQLRRVGIARGGAVSHLRLSVAAE